jgi:hypothetical protein
VIQEAVTIIVFAVFSTLVLKEKLQGTDWIAFGLIMAAVVVSQAGRMRSRIFPRRRGKPVVAVVAARLCGQAHGRMRIRAVPWRRSVRRHDVGVIPVFARQRRAGRSRGALPALRASPRPNAGYAQFPRRWSVRRHDVGVIPVFARQGAAGRSRGALPGFAGKPTAERGYAQFHGAGACVVTMVA